MRIEWLSLAEDDISVIYAWYAQFSLKVAYKVVNSIVSDVELLSTQPRMGRKEMELEKKMGHEIRSFVTTRDYKIIYVIKGDTIFISRIWDCRQNPNDLKI